MRTVILATLLMLLATGANAGIIRGSIKVTKSVVKTGTHVVVKTAQVTKRVVY